MVDADTVIEPLLMKLALASALVLDTWRSMSTWPVLQLIMPSMLLLPPTH